MLYGQKMVAGSLLASLSGAPFYFCSGAELPLVRELLEKGMGRGPGTAMLLSVPIVNILTFGVVARSAGRAEGAGLPHPLRRGLDRPRIDRRLALAVRVAV